MRALALIAAVGCGDGGSAVIDAAPVAIDAPALEPYQQRIVAVLGGTEPIAPNLFLDHRANEIERMHARRFITDELAALGYVVTPHTYATGANVVARLEATIGDGPLIVVGAHFDSVPAGPGAADNATGVAIVLAAARHLASVPDRTHPIAFVLFDEEELGLIGSRAYARSLADAGTPLAGAHVFDMLSFDGDGDRAVELWSPSAPLLALYQEHGARMGTPITAVEFDRSDHTAFHEQGFAAVGVGEEFVGGDHTPHYHKATDTVDRISFAHLATVTELALSVLTAQATE